MQDYYISRVYQWYSHQLKCSHIQVFQDTLHTHKQPYGFMITFCFLI